MSTAIIAYRKKCKPPMRESGIKRFEVKEGYATPYDLVKFIGRNSPSLCIRPPIQ